MTDAPLDILIRNGRVLTMDPDLTEVRDGAVAIRGEQIVAVGGSETVGRRSARRVIDARGGIVMPGLVNTHTHAAMTLFRGLADDVPLMRWLNDHIFPAEAALDPHQVYCGALLACAEMILSGTTTFCDMYLFEDAVARAVQAAGMRAVVGEVLFDFPSPNYGPIEQGFEYTANLIARYRDDPLITIAVEPHSPYLCAPELLQRAYELAGRHGLPMVIHLAETVSEVQTVRQRYGRTPVEHLDQVGVLGPHVLACHCVQLTEADIERLRRYDVKVSHNPESNMKLASGIAPVPDLIAAGVCVGLGTDGAASNNNLDLLLEMDTAAKLAKVHRLDPTALDAATVLRMATRAGARALGLEARIGSLEPGKRADVILIDTHRPHLTPLYHPSSQLVYAAKGSDVATVIINGRIVMQDGRILSFDVDQAMADVNQIAVRLK
jgi:5-methylthioadenosine/S-adenosylhomocysteine deaminase